MGIMRRRMRRRAIIAGAATAGVAYHVGAAFAAFVPMLEASLAQWGGLSLRASVGLVSAACEVALVAVVLAQRAVLSGRSPSAPERLSTLPSSPLKGASVS